MLRGKEVQPIDPIIQEKVAQYVHLLGKDIDDLSIDDLRLGCVLAGDPDVRDYFAELLIARVNPYG